MTDARHDTSYDVTAKEPPCTERFARWCGRTAGNRVFSLWTQDYNLVSFFLHASQLDDRTSKLYRWTRIRNPKLRNPKSEIAESEIAKSEIRNRRIRNSTSKILGKSKRLRLRRRRRNRKYRVQSAHCDSIKYRFNRCVNRCVKRCVKVALISASKVRQSTRQISALQQANRSVSDAEISALRQDNRCVKGASKVRQSARQSARLRRRNIWFSGCSIGASPTQKYLVQSNRHRSRISFRYGSIGASKMRQISGSPTAQSARHRITLIVSNCIRAKLP